MKSLEISDGVIRLGLINRRKQSTIYLRVICYTRNSQKHIVCHWRNIWTVFLSVIIVLKAKKNIKTNVLF